MGSGPFEVRWVLDDAQGPAAELAERLQVIAAETSVPGSEFACTDVKVEALHGQNALNFQNPLLGAHLVVFDAAAADAATVRTLAGAQALLVALLAQSAPVALTDSVCTTADEVWFMPAPPAYTERRFLAALSLLRERRQARFTRIHLDAVIDNSPDLIWFKDLRGAHLKVNEAFCTAVGKTKQQIEGRGHYYIWDISPDEYASGEFVCLETEEIVLNKRTRCLFDEKVLCKQGLRQFKTYKAPLIDDNGSLLGTVGVAQDVTRHIQTASRLSERMANIQVAVDTAQVYHWRFDPVTRTARLGHTYATEMGLPRVLENYPHSLVDRGAIHPDTVQACLDMHKLLQNRRNDSFYDVCLRLPDGRERWKRIRYRFSEDENSGEGEFLGIGEDITEYKRMEKYFIISARQNGITSWVYDAENRSIYSVVDPLNALGMSRGIVENVPEVFTTTLRLHKDDLQAVLDLHLKVTRGERSASAVVRWVRPGTTDWSWFRLSYTTIFNKQGAPVRAIGSALDITQQIKAEHLYSRQRAYRDSRTRNALGTMVLNLSTNVIQEATGDFERYLADSVDGLFALFSSQPYLGNHPEIIPFCDRQRLLDNFNKNITHERLNHPYRRPSDGDIIWVQSTFNTIRNPDTGDVEAFVEVKDIDDHKIMEACFSAAAVQDNEDLVCVNLRNGTFRVIYNKGQVLDTSSGAKARPYNEQVIEAPLSRIPECEREKHRQAMRLETVEARLEKHGYHTVQGTYLDEQGEPHQKRVRFTWLDQSRGLVCMVVSDITKAVAAERRKNMVLRKALATAKDSSRSKTAFLANMSHEIRTPMNTIIGMSQILLNKALPAEVTDGILAIQTASNGLLAIINDILDFSKVESGKFTLHEGPYMPASLLMDVSSLMSVRLAEKPIQFLINVNPEIPVMLRGDDTRLRQVLANIIGNAVKYTVRGYITLNVDGVKLPDGRFRLEMKVIDTGIGIREEDLPLLFEQFSRVDTTRNRHITGTGLGLALSRGFARMMEGDITVSSVYGEGSEFTITVVQQVEQEDPIARVRIRGQHILVFEPDMVLSAALSEGLNQLGVSCSVCGTLAELALLVEQKHVTHVVLRRKNFTPARQLLEPLSLESNLILLLENGETADAQHMRHKQMHLPLFCLQIADFFNGESRFAENRRIGFDTSKITPYPGVRVLVVDDSITNLQVAKGLFAPYRMQVETATSGYDALEMVRCQRYDLIFMDHMMPELDGVETTARIRALGGDYCTRVPIIALTANAMMGARETFLEQGMTDFLAKPIEISKLHRILKTWAEPVARRISVGTPIPPPAQTQRIVDIGSMNDIEELNTERALAIYGSPDIYHDVLSTYAIDMARRIPELRRYIERSDLEAFSISVHAIKSASKSVGAEGLGSMAEQLELLSAARNRAGVDELFESFMELLQRVTERVAAYIREHVTGPEQVEDKPRLEQFNAELMDRLRSACADMDYVLAEKVLEEMDANSYPKALQEHFTRMKNCCAEFDYAMLDELVESVTKNVEAS